jgi:GT2 family glycosyltransferase
MPKPPAKMIAWLSASALGSSGGFHTGVKYAYENGADWVWIMDDDVIPKNNCLEVLLHYSNQSKCLNPVHFDSRGEMLDEERWFDITNCNIINLFNQSYKSGKKIWYRNIGSFEGMLISKEIIQKIGYPDKRFFITHDDLIYGYLANKHTNVAVISDAVMNKMEVNKTDKSVYSYHYYYHRNYWLLQEYAEKDLPGFIGYRKRRIIINFFYASYQVIRGNEFKDRWQALSTLWKAYRDYKNKKEGQSFQ